MNKIVGRVLKITSAAQTLVATKVPAIAQPMADIKALTKAVEAIKEIIEVREGQRGSPLDQSVTWRDLAANGVVKLNIGGQEYGGMPGDGGGVGLPLPNPSDPTPPPAPTGFAASGALANIMLTWNEPDYGNHAYTEIWRSATDDIGTAVLLGTSRSRFYVDAVGAAATYYYWARFVSVFPVTGPYNGTVGTLGKTSIDPGYLLDLLTGELTASQLHADLGSRIGLIDAPATGLLTRIGQTESQIAAINASLSDISATPVYDPAATYAVDNLVKYNGGLYRAITTTTGNLPTNPTYWEKIGDYSSLGDAVSAHAAQLSDHETRITNTSSGLVAETSTRQQLSTAVTGAANPSGLTLGTLSSGLIYDEMASRSSADQTEVTARRLLSTKLIGVPDPSSASLGNITSGIIYDEKTARSTETGALAGRATALESSVSNPQTGLGSKAAISYVDSAISTEQTARANAITTLQSKVDAAFYVENWDGTDPLAQWHTFQGGGELSIVASTEAQTGSKVLRIGNNSGNDEWWAASTALMPVDPEATCKIVTRVRRTAGSGDVYLGVAGVAADRTTLVNSAGSNTHAGQHFTNLVQAAGIVNGTWITLEGYLKPVGSGGLNGSSVTTPVPLHSSVRYIRPLLILGYAGMAGTWEVDFVRLEPLASNIASVQVSASTSASKVAGLEAQYAVKIDTNGYVSGYGLATSAPVNATPTSTFAVRADSFYIANPAGPGTVSPAIPFVVRTTATSINGVNVPVGVYISDTFIQNGTITNAKIGDAAIDDAKIANLSAAKITAGDIDADRMKANIVTAISGRFNSLSAITSTLGTVQISAAGHLRTANATAYGIGVGIWMGDDGGIYKFRVGDPTGNRIQWNGSTLTIVGGGTFSGALSAATGTFAGSLSAATGTFSGSLSAATGTFAGSLSAANGTFRGALNAATGTFAGSLSAANGTFSGTLTASAINAVNTINLAGQAVTIPVNAYGAGEGGYLSGNTLVSAGITSTGAPMTVIVSAHLRVPSSEFGGNFATVGIYRDGIDLGIYRTVNNGQEDMFCFSIAETPGAGGHTYSLVAYQVNAEALYARNRSITILETKR